MIVLDTNVISETIRSNPDLRVSEWLASQPRIAVFTTSVTEAELRLGNAMMPAGRRRDALAIVLEQILSEDFRGRILPFDSGAAAPYVDTVMARRRAGRPISQSDAQIAAIVRSQAAILATRNTADFEGCGIELFNPWALQP